LFTIGEQIYTLNFRGPVEPVAVWAIKGGMSTLETPPAPSRTTDRTGSSIVQTQKHTDILSTCFHSAETPSVKSGARSSSFTVR